MNPKTLNVRMDRDSGDFWLTQERYRQPIRKLTNITQPVLLALCADLFDMPGTTEVTRDVKFADGSVVRLTVQELPPES